MLVVVVGLCLWSWEIKGWEPPEKEEIITSLLTLQSNVSATRYVIGPIMVLFISLFNDDMTSIAASPKINHSQIGNLDLLLVRMQMGKFHRTIWLLFKLKD